MDIFQRGDYQANKYNKMKDVLKILPFQDLTISFLIPRSVRRGTKKAMMLSMERLRVLHRVGMELPVHPHKQHQSVATCLTDSPCFCDCRFATTRLNTMSTAPAATCHESFSSRNTTPKTTP